MGYPEREYWNQKYDRGGRSGKGSIGKYRHWKWMKIYEVIGSFKEIIDVGCGDLTFWLHPYGTHLMTKPDFKYVGIDISDRIIKKNRENYKHLEFHNYASDHYLHELNASVVFALDLLFHIMDYDRLKITLENLCLYSNDWIVIYNWHNNPFQDKGLVTDDISQHFWELESYELKDIFLDHGFKRKDEFKVPFDPWGKLYFYQFEGLY